MMHESLDDYIMPDYGYAGNELRSLGRYVIAV